VARAQGSELFVAASLLVVVGAGVAAEAAGLSMSLGALVAGLLLAETEYRREVEVSIEPFKGLLLGVFFIGVGISLDLDAVAADPGGVVALAVGLTAAKAAVIFGLARLWGVPARAAIETALVLGPAGEFAFVILTTGMVEGLAPPDFARGLMASATLSLFMVPPLAMIAQKLAPRVAPPALPTEAPDQDGEPEGASVLIVGFGRVGRLVGEMLAEHGQTFVAVDADPVAVSAARKEGLPVYFGDAGRAEMLRRCGLQHVRALVVTMDSPAKVDQVVTAARALRADVTLIARARDDRHAARLYSLGVTDAVPETTEASLQLAENTLVDLGVPMGLVLASIHERRDVFRRLFQASTPEARQGRPNRALRRREPNRTPDLGDA
jgi:CPA2 family monovalent cation:H+ antiporter-2